jgi:hypothetical protein
MNLYLFWAQMFANCGNQRMAEAAMKAYVRERIRIAWVMEHWDHPNCLCSLDGKA